MIDIPRYNRKEGKWEVVWGEASFKFVSYEQARTFYEYNKEWVK